MSGTQTVRTARSRVRVVIVEDHTLFAESLELALTIGGYDARRVTVTEQATSHAAVLAQVIRAKPRIVLLDLDLGRLGDGVRLIAPIAKSGADVVVVTADTDRARWGECLKNGARTVVAKARPLNDTLATVRRLNSGLPVMDRAERDELLARWHSTAQVRSERRLRLDRHRLPGRPEQLGGAGKRRAPAHWSWHRCSTSRAS